MKLNDREWREFYIGGNDGIFKITSTSSGIDKNKLIDTGEQGNIPYITRTEINNGINLFVLEKQKDNCRIDEGNVITIGLDTQTVFYQQHRFYTGQNIQVLRHPKLNKINSLFIIPLLKVQMKKFNWGGNGATLGRLFRTKLMLPVDSSNNPDWVFMESYIKEQYKIKEDAYKKYVKEVKKDMNYQELISLDKKEWKEFFLTDLFPVIQRGKRLTKANQIDGTIPYVSSTSLNNGVDNYVSNSEKVRRFADCLTVANSGSVGSSFYQPFEFVASDHVTHFKNSDMNKYVYLFIAVYDNLKLPH